MWIRVFSREESGNIVYWKGPQSTDAVPTPSGTDEQWSVDPLAPDGWFTTIKPHYWGTSSTFNRGFNRIGEGMDLKMAVESDPGQVVTGQPPLGVINETGGIVFTEYNSTWNVMTQGCSPVERTITHNLFPAGDTEAWSNHFCAGGLAYGPGGDGFPVYENQNSQWQCEHYEMSCTSGECTRWCKPDWDGCGGKFNTPKPTKGDKLVGEFPILTGIMKANQSDVAPLNLGYSGFWTANQKIYTVFYGTTAYHYNIYLKPPDGYSCKSALVMYAKKKSNGWNFTDENRPYRKTVTPNILENGICVYDVGKYPSIILPEIFQVKTNACVVEVQGGSTTTFKNVVKVSTNTKAPQPVTINAYGLSNDNRTANAGFTRLWLLNATARAFTLLNGNTMESLGYTLSPPFAAPKEYVKIYAPPSATCTSTNLQACNPVINTLLNRYGDIDSRLMEGVYYAYCDMPNAPAGEPDGKCSGFPLCNFNTEKIDKLCSFLGISNCSTTLNESWVCGNLRACQPKPDTPTDLSDIAVIHASCTPYCNQCEQSGAFDGCGATCGSSNFCKGGTNDGQFCTVATATADCGAGATCEPFVSYADPPAAITGLATNSPTNLCSAGAAAFTVRWDASSPGTTYEVAGFRQSEYTNEAELETVITSAIAAGTAKTWVPIPGTNPNIVIATTDLTTIGPDLRLAVRAVSTVCGVQKGPWSSIRVNLTCDQTPAQNLRVEVINGTGSGVRCAGSGTLLTSVNSPAFFDPTTGVRAVVQLNASGPTLPFGLVGPATTVGGNSVSSAFSNPASASIANLWYLPQAWWPASQHSYRVSLSKTKDQLANDYNLAMICPTGAGTPSQLISLPDAETPQGIIRFFVKPGFDPWWRAVGGLVGAAGNSIISKIPMTCENDGTCIDALIATNPQAAKGITNETGGLAIAGNGGTVNAGNGAFTMHPGNIHAQGSILLPKKGGYSYFKNRLSQAGVTNSTSGVQISAANLVTDGPASGTTVAIDGQNYYIWMIGNNNDPAYITITIDPLKWNITTNKVIILVDDDLTLDTSSGQPGDFVQVATTGPDPSGFLAIVSRGNMTFAPSLGRDRLAGGGEAPVINEIRPSVTGIFISDKILKVANDNPLTSDKQFVGNGIFAGLQDLILERDFEADEDGEGRVFNNLHASETFIHNPQMVLNTPEFLKEPGISFQEIQ